MAETGLPQISTGDMLRDAVARKTSLGLEAKKVMDAGGLVEDRIVNGIVAERTAAADCAAGFILDGYPRNVVQAGMFEDGLGADDHVLVVELAVDTEALVRRLTARRTCASCGAIFNLTARRPAQEGVCDTCGGELVERADDSESVIRDRLRTYEAQTRPLADYYRAKDVFSQVDGMGPIDQVSERLVALIRRLAA
jgi:adenylate kinase